MKPEIVVMDHLQDISETLERMEAHSKRVILPPTIKVDMPPMPQPRVTVEPRINVEVPKIELPSSPRNWKFSITKRDVNGDIIEFTASAQ
jgi:hypothetical protein